MFANWLIQHNYVIAKWDIMNAITKKDDSLPRLNYYYFLHFHYFLHFTTDYTLYDCVCDK